MMQSKVINRKTLKHKKATQRDSFISYVALLRGINVGGNNKVNMAQLRTCFESLGFNNVRTYINSGNVIFETARDSIPTLITRIETRLKKEFSFVIMVIVRDALSMKKIAAAIPKEWKNDDHQKSDVLFLAKAYDTKKSLSLISLNPKVDNLIYVPGAILWNIDRKLYSKSGMHDFIGTELYRNMTARNVNTVRKLDTLVS